MSQPYKDVLREMWVVVKFEGERFLGKVLQKRCGEYMVRCLSMLFGMNTHQEFDEDEGTYYTDVYQSNIAPENKQIYKDSKNQESIITCTKSLKDRYISYLIDVLFLFKFF